MLMAISDIYIRAVKELSVKKLELNKSMRVFSWERT